MNRNIVLITGTNSSASFAAACKLAQLGALVTVLCRNRIRVPASQSDIAKAATGAPPTSLLAVKSTSAARQSGNCVRVRLK